MPILTAKQTWKRTPVALTKWEYTCVAGAGEGDVQQVAAQLGVQAWEMAGAAANASHQPVWCFKRPKM